MRAALWGLVLAATAEARPHRLPSHDPALGMPQRVVLSQKGVRFANCIFGASELPERAGGDVATRSQFDDSTAIWGRCYLPDAYTGGEGADLVIVDDQPAAELAWDKTPSGAWSRLAPYGQLLRAVLSSLPRGMHHVRIQGGLKHGAKRTKLYEGEFRYVR